MALYYHIYRLTNTSPFPSENIEKITSFPQALSQNITLSTTHHVTYTKLPPEISKQLQSSSTSGCLENRQEQSESSLLRREWTHAVDSVVERVHNSSGSRTANASCIKTDELAALETTEFRLHHVLQEAPVGHKREALRSGNNLASWVDASRGHSARHRKANL